ncbi:MAG: CPBP family intramembrane metalloprotease [Sphingobacteriaceae bacterium]|nr:CPBP family intramembrane metalloprotease [Sphingobacteriaceae bacterium]
MNQIQHKYEENKAYTQFFMLIGYSVLGIIICSILALIFCTAIYGLDFLTSFDSEMIQSSKYLNGFKIFQIFSSIGLFLVGPIWLAYAEGRNVFDFYSIKKTSLKIILIVFCILFFGAPMMELLSNLNQKIILPDFLQGLENWMKMQEDDAEKLTLLLLKGDTFLDLGINLFMIALIPAICEELMFRGALQHVFNRVFKNKHLTIWLVSVIFSAIHFQFYGFFPRLLLGVCFGYLYHWSGNISYAIVAHFINNAFVTLLAWKMQKENISLTELDKPINFEWYYYVISLIFTLLLFYYFKIKTKHHDTKLD